MKNQKKQKIISQNENINRKTKQEKKYEYIYNIPLKKQKFTDISVARNNQDLLAIEIQETAIQNNQIENLIPLNKYKKQKQIKHCVICLEEGVLINPCSCSGQYHKQCLTSWIQRRKKNKLQFKKCQICLQLYSVKMLYRLQFSSKKFIQLLKNPTCIFFKETIKLILIIFVTMFLFSFIFLFEFNLKVKTMIMEIVSVQELTVSALIVVIWTIIFGICVVAARQYYLEYCTQQKLELKQVKNIWQNNEQIEESISNYSNNQS